MITGSLTTDKFNVKVILSYDIDSVINLYKVIVTESVNALATIDIYIDNRFDIPAKYSFGGLTGSMSYINLKTNKTTGFSFLVTEIKLSKEGYKVIHCINTNYYNHYVRHSSYLGDNIQSALSALNFRSSYNNLVNYNSNFFLINDTVDNKALTILKGVGNSHIFNITESYVDIIDLSKASDNVVPWQEPLAIEECTTLILPYIDDITSTYELNQDDTSDPPTFYESSFLDNNYMSNKEVNKQYIINLVQSGIYRTNVKYQLFASYMELVDTNLGACSMITRSEYPQSYYILLSKVSTLTVSDAIVSTLWGSYI